MADREARHEEYKGHRIEWRSEQVGRDSPAEAKGEAAPDLLIDGVPIGHGQLPDGLYFLHDYAYDWQDDLMELARRFVDYRTKTEETSGHEVQGGE